MKKLWLIGLVMLAACDNKTVYVDSATGAPVARPESRVLSEISYYQSVNLDTMNRTCIDGVVYIRYDRSLTVAYTSSGHIARCEGSQIK